MYIYMWRKSWHKILGFHRRRVWKKAAVMKCRSAPLTSLPALLAPGLKWLNWIWAAEKATGRFCIIFFFLPIQFWCSGARKFPSEATLRTVVCLCRNPRRFEPNWLQCILSVQKSHWVTLKMKQRVIAVPPRLALLSRKTSTFNNFPGRYGCRLRGHNLYVTHGTVQTS